MTSLDRIAYTARASATGGRAGRARTDDGLLEGDLAHPPRWVPRRCDQPRAAVRRRYAACFQGALGAVGRKRRIDTSGSLVTAR